MQNIIKVYYMLRGFYSIYFITYIISISLLVMFFEGFTLTLVIPLISTIFQNFDQNFLISYFNFKLNPLALSIFVIIFFLTKLIFLTYALFIQTNFYVRFKVYLSQKIFKSYLELPYNIHVNTNSSIILRNILVETENVASTVKLIITILTEALVLIGILFVLIIFQPIGSMVLISSVLIFSLVFYFFFKGRLLRWGKLRQFHEGKRIQKINEGIKGIVEVKLSKGLKFFLNSFQKHNEVSNEVHRKRTLVQNFPKIYLEFVLLTSLILFAITLFNFNNDLNYIISSLALFTAAAFRAVPSIQRILTSYQTIRFTIPAIEKVHEEFKKFNDNFYSISKEHIEFKSLIKFHNVCFSYNSKKNKPIFSDLNISVNKGDFVGIIGKSGTGKTTFFNLLAGLISPTSGSIYVDNNKLKKESINWTRQVGYVPQKCFIIDGSLKFNICLEDENIDLRKLDKIINDLDLTEFVNNLDEGVDTEIGEEGIKISGGQRQRIGIARALYKDPALLIFDEVTSSLDKNTEDLIINNIKQLSLNKTILMISHNKKVLFNCNKKFSLVDKNLSLSN